MKEEWHLPHRDELLAEIHERQPFSCGPFVRATRNTFAFPSLKDRILDHVEKQVGKPDAKFQTSQGFARALGKVSPLFDSEGKETPEEKARRDARKEEYNNANRMLEDAVQVAETYDTDLYIDNARKWFRARINDARQKVEDDENTFQALHPRSSHVMQRDPIKDLDEEAYRVDLHWAPDKYDYRLRARWELYGHSQNFSVFEDIANGRIVHPGTDCEGIKRFKDQEYSDGDKYDAFAAFLDGVGQLENCPDNQALERERRIERAVKSIEGDVLTSARYWLAPLDWFLMQRESCTEQQARKAAACLRKYAKWRCGKINDGTLASGEKPEHEEQEFALKLIRQIADFARDKWFKIPTDGIDFSDNMSAHDTVYRDDFVYSFVVDGNALLISDLRPCEYTEDVSYTRTLIIDFSLAPEQRGRLLQRLMDLASFRILGLRGHPMTNPTIDALTNVGRVLNTTWKASEQIDDNKLDDEKAQTALDRLRRISWTLDRLNMLFLYGVTGKRMSTSVYSEQISNILKNLRETRVEGWQTLREYMDRYFHSADQIERMANRYNNVRERVGSSTELLNTIFNQRQIQQLNKAAHEHSSLMKRAILASALAAFAAILALFPKIGATIEKGIAFALHYVNEAIQFIASCF